MSREVRDRYGRSIAFICCKCDQERTGFIYGYYTCSQCHEQEKRDKVQEQILMNLQKLNKDE